MDAVAYENGIRRTEYSDETLSILIDDLFHCFCGVVSISSFEEIFLYVF